MNELIFLKAGMLIGYMVCVFIYSLVLILQYHKYITKVNKYLLETKQHQKFEEFLYKNKTKLKVVKNG